MIAAKSFVEAARACGFSRYTGVPCSYLTPFINYVRRDAALNYISAANEGDALASASGAAIGGERAVVMLQNSGLGNAVNPLTSLNYVFRIPVLLIISHRGEPGQKDEPQHELMGAITTALLDTMKIPWEPFPDQERQIQAVLERATNYMQAASRPYALIMRKGAVAAGVEEGPSASPNTSLISSPDASPSPTGLSMGDDTEAQHARPSRREALQKVIAATPQEDTVVIATTGFTGRELCALADRKNQLYMVGSMGCASSLALGLALAKPALRIVVVDGDGAALMRLGNFATIGHYAPPGLIHLLLDNEVHDSTGAQATASTTVDFAAIARACGYGMSLRGDGLGLLDALFADTAPPGPRFAQLKIRPGSMADLPRPPQPPDEVLRRLMRHIGSAF